MAPPWELPKPSGFKSQLQWQIKIYDNEAEFESPHINVLQKLGKKSRKTWRVRLDTLEIMDINPPARELPKEILEHLKAEIVEIRKGWNKTHEKRKIDLETGALIRTVAEKKTKATRKKGRKK